MILAHTVGSDLVVPAQRFFASKQEEFDGKGGLPTVKIA